MWGFSSNKRPGDQDLWGYQSSDSEDTEVKTQQLQKGYSPCSSSSVKKSPKEIEIPHRLLCPITEDLMQDPVVLVQSGHVYERSAIEQWLSIKNTDPITNTKIKNKQVVSVHILRSECDEFRKKIDRKKFLQNDDDDDSDIKKIAELQLAEQILSDKKSYLKQLEKIVFQNDNDVCSIGYEIQMSDLGQICGKLRTINQELKKLFDVHVSDFSKPIIFQKFAELEKFIDKLVDDSNQQTTSQKLQDGSDIKLIFQEYKKQYKQLKNLVNLMRSNLYSNNNNYQTSISPSSSQQQLPTSSYYVWPEKKVASKQVFNKKQQQSFQNPDQVLNFSIRNNNNNNITTKNNINKILQNIESNLNFTLGRTTKNNINRVLQQSINEVYTPQKIDIDEFIEQIESGIVTNAFLHIDERVQQYIIEDHTIEIIIDVPLQIQNLHVTNTLPTCNNIKIISDSPIQIQNSTFTGIGLYLEDNNWSIGTDIIIRDTCVSYVPYYGIVMKDLGFFSFDSVVITECDRSGICCRNSNGFVENSQISDCGKFGIWLDNDSDVSHEQISFRNNFSGNIYFSANTQRNF